MADNVAITAGAGTTIATDDVAGVHYQQVKLVASALDSSSPLSRAEDAAHSDGEHGIMLLGVRNYTGPGTDGDYSALSVDSSGNLRVNVQKDLVRISASVPGVTTNGTSYTAGDQVGTLISLASAVRTSGGTGAIVGATLTDGKNIIGAYDVVFFRTNGQTLASDNGPFSIAAGDRTTVIQLVQLTQSYPFNNARIAQAQNIYVPFDCAATTLYAALICRAGHSNTWTNGAAEAELVVHIERN
jgi:hypothetical protein